jgi:predicted O-methyltransferase YrrM
MFSTEMIFSQSVKYLSYILLSRHKWGHGIHSPFVFDLVSRVFGNRIDPSIAIAVEQVRKKMLSDKRSINVHDLGSHSELLYSNHRKVKEIARYSPVPMKYGKLLSNMAAEFGNPLIIELGTSMGISAMYMALSNKETAVYTIEGCPETAEIARQNILIAGLDNIKIFEGMFEDVLSELATRGIKPGLVFIDGNHRKEPVKKYFSQITEFSGPKTVIIIDDINYSKEMAEAWEEIKLHEKVSISIDIFKIGRAHV